VRGEKNTQTGRGACSGRLTICAPVYPVSGGYALDEAWQGFFHQLPADAAVLDVGTGNGALALLARETLGPFAEVHGVDVAEIDPTTFVSSEEGLQSITFHPGVAMEQLPFDDDVFNAVVGQYALEYSDTARSVVEVLRVLKGDGRFRFLVHASGGTLEARNVLQQRQAQTQRSALNEKRFPVYTARRPRVVLSGLCCG